MNIFHKLSWHYQHYGIFGTIKKELWKRFCKNGPPVPKTNSDEIVTENEEDDNNESTAVEAKSIQEILDERFLPIRPIAGFTIPYNKRRLNLITDSINSGSLFGGVATSLILATLLAKKWGYDLRIITRLEEANKYNFLRILTANGLTYSQNVEFIHSNIFEPDEIPLGTEEIFLTTSWWSTWSVRNLINDENIIYLLQEDERTFYPYGDDRLHSSIIFQNPTIKFIVNSKLLFDALVNDGFENMKKNGTWFEPAFSEKSFYLEELPHNDKLNFFFYARPNNLRNLFYFGLKVIKQTLEQNILNPNDWDFYFLGKDIPDILIVNGTKPYIYQNLPWSEYADVIRNMDLGLSLMYSPHPSYPPLDLAASGAVVVTNKYKNKQTLDMYSKNIICKDLETQELVQGIKEGVTLAKDFQSRVDNFNNSTIIRDWETAFKDTLQWISNKYNVSS